MRRSRLVGLSVLGLALLALVVLGVGLPALGLWLVVADPLEPSDAIVVLDGQTPARELEAAALFHRGLAPHIILARAHDPYQSAREMAGEPSPQARALRVLVHRQVPRGAVQALERVVENTADELAVDFEHARARGFRRVILVTSPAHTRRVRVIWDARYQAALPAIVHPTPHDPFDARRWWRSRRGLETAIHELIGILNFAVGDPVPTDGARRTPVDGRDLRE